MITEHERILATIAGRYDPSTDTGYYGFVESSGLITGDQLSEQLDFNVGTNHNSDCGWLKFYIGPNAVCNDTDHQKIVYVSKKSLKHSVSWGNIDDENLIMGDRTIDINGVAYRVRLLTGGKFNSGGDSEWNELMIRVHNDNYSEKSTWDEYDNYGLNINNGDGRCTWVQDHKNDYAVFRGFHGIDRLVMSAFSTAYVYSGWRPVLEPTDPTVSMP